MHTHILRLKYCCWFGYNSMSIVCQNLNTKPLYEVKLCNCNLPGRFEGLCVAVQGEHWELQGVRRVITAVKCSLAAQQTAVSSTLSGLFLQHRLLEAFSVTKPTQAGTTQVKRLLTEANKWVTHSPLECSSITTDMWSVSQRSQPNAA